jgi:uncharacterized protein YutE (UPF0331/DUF86 family)
MTDADLVSKKLAFVETCVRDLETLARPERVGFDVREERFIAHTLQIAIQAALDVASHIVSDERLGEPADNRDLFRRLAAAGWIPAELAPTLVAMVGFRNVVVQGYERVDLEVMRRLVDERLGDLLAYTAAIRARMRA